jgi:hypothetical protein
LLTHGKTLRNEEGSWVLQIDRVDNRHLAITRERRGHLLLSLGFLRNGKTKMPDSIGALIDQASDPPQRLRQGDSLSLKAQFLVLGNGPKYGKAEGLMQVRLRHRPAQDDVLLADPG